MKRNWLYTILPISAISNGLAVLIPLYILALKGDVFDVGVALTIFNLVGIPASLFWGDFTDRIKRNKLIIVVSIVGTIPILLILYFVAFIPSIEASYGVYSFIATAASPAINILIMKRNRSQSLPRYFSEYSVLSILGGFIALVPGILLDRQNISEYLIMLLILNVIALILALKLIEKDKTHRIKQAAAIKKSFSLLNALSTTPHILTGYALIERIRSAIKIKSVRRVYLLLLTMALFDAGLALFNTSYIPFLNDRGVDFAGIFVINIANYIGQLVVYTMFMYFTRRFNLAAYYEVSTLLRGASYFLAFVPFIFTSFLFFYTNVVAYLFSGIAYAMFNVASSVMMYNQINKLSRGHYIGIWFSILSLSTVVSSFFSGVISQVFNYYLTFSIAIIIMLGSFIAFRNIRRSYSPASMTSVD
ncbi:MAG: MFS transporter [Candidatus Acidifodinimicrobium sp.]